MNMITCTTLLKTVNEVYFNEILANVFCLTTICEAVADSGLSMGAALTSDANTFWLKRKNSVPFRGGGHRRRPPGSANVRITHHDNNVVRLPRHSVLVGSSTLIRARVYHISHLETRNPNGLCYGTADKTKNLTSFVVIPENYGRRHGVLP